MNKKQQSKRVALTTKTLCNIDNGGKYDYTRIYSCPCAVGRWWCKLDKKPIKINKKGRPTRSDVCKANFPGIIVMTAMEER